MVRKVRHLEPVNLAFGTRTSLNELISEIGDLLGFQPEVEHLPTRAGDVRDSQADNSSLLRHFPEVQAVSLREGLKATIDWFRTQPAYQR